MIVILLHLPADAMLLLGGIKRAKMQFLLTEACVPEVPPSPSMSFSSRLVSCCARAQNRCDHDPREGLNSRRTLRRWAGVQTNYAQRATRPLTCFAFFLHPLW